MTSIYYSKRIVGAAIWLFDEFLLQVATVDDKWLLAAE
jgi:hypothetical protein